MERYTETDREIHRQDQQTEKYIKRQIDKEKYRDRQTMRYTS